MTFEKLQLVQGLHLIQQESSKGGLTPWHWWIISVTWLAVSMLDSILPKVARLQYMQCIQMHPGRCHSALLLSYLRFHFRTTAARLNPLGCRAIYHQSIRIQNIMTSQNLLQEKLHHSPLYRLSRHIKTLGWPVVSDLEEHSCTLRPGPTGWQTSSEWTENANLQNN